MHFGATPLPTPETIRYALEPVPGSRGRGWRYASVIVDIAAGVLLLGVFFNHPDGYAATSLVLGAVGTVVALIAIARSERGNRATAVVALVAAALIALTGQLIPT